MSHKQLSLLAVVECRANDDNKTSSK